MAGAPERTPHILIVDDRSEDRALCRAILEGAAGEHYRITEAATAEEGWRLCQASPPDCVLLDYQMPSVDGLEFLRRLREPRGIAPVAVIMLTGHGDPAVDLAAMHSGAEDFIPKDLLEPALLRRAIRHAIDRHSVSLALHESEEALRRARDEALQASRAKSEFVANMSHEIRTPMNGVVGMIEVLLDSKLTRPQRDAAETIRYSAQSLLTIINDILDFSKVEAGALRLEQTDLEVRELLHRAIRLAAESAAAKRLKLAVAVDEAVPRWLRGDPVRLSQVLTNLVSNAVKFTDRGEVKAAVKLERTAGADVLLRFSVSDTGIGIPAEAQRRLFQPFVQADGSTTRKYGGTGLGLAISKRLVALMGGEIGVESRPGEGSSFWFTARLGRSAPAAQAARAPAAGAAENSQPAGRWRILAAEDNPVNQLVTRRQLQLLGLKADFVENGREALETLRQTPYDIVLMDCQMPELDGYGVTEQVRRQDGPNRNTWIVAMTAHAMAGDREKCLAAGMNDYLAKPVTAQALRDALERFRRREESG